MKYPTRYAVIKDGVEVFSSTFDLAAYAFKRLIDGSKVVKSNTKPPKGY